MTGAVRSPGLVVMAVVVCVALLAFAAWLFRFTIQQERDRRRLVRDDPDAWQPPTLDQAMKASGWLVLGSVFIGAGLTHLTTVGTAFWIVLIPSLILLVLLIVPAWRRERSNKNDKERRKR